MPPSPESLPTAPETINEGQTPAQLREAFLRAWQSGQRPRIEDYLVVASTEERSHVLQMLLRDELAFRKQASEQLTFADYLSRFPGDRDTVVQAFDQTDKASSSEVDYATVVPENISIPETSKHATEGSVSATARYRKVRKLGEGAFGVVWLVDDLELKRQVAWKEPLADRLRAAADVEAYLAEARILASLDHPHIVPVYDVGRTADGSCYVVSKLIDGMDLASYVSKKTLTFDQSARLVAQVADALQHTHNRKLVHRDIKPANILIDHVGNPYVTDFGLALREEELDKLPGLAGTPEYMSPEQARGESHLIDGRSDIFSLGVVLYELLTGTRPFQGGTWQEVLKRIKTDDPKPLRQRNDAIPKELERICLKALAKRAADRYHCATDFADDLRQWSAPAAGNPRNPAELRIVPKGLRSFDANDSDFFLELLPGPRDRDGLPESLRFWKTRIEERDADKTFRVGLLYGPSGCGKSSLVKAGLLPRLADSVIRILFEATPDQTEKQLLHVLQKTCADLPRDLSLTETLATIRRGKGIPASRKLLIVLDQFEQWLYAHGADHDTELAAALRQCDGERIQAVLLVRDDFWVPISEFMRAIEVQLLEGTNAALVSLFDPLHARKVLTEFGKSYGRLPEKLSDLSSSQAEFLDKAVSGLAQDGKVICVRLSLFADMMQGRIWTPATLDAVGGTAGVGLTFLEETFSSRSAPPQHRYHQEAARAVLRALLPASGTEIKGHMRTSRELQEACGYSSRPEDFAELMRILDSEVRLLTPVTVDGGEPSYQLTHDYLVPSLRDWLTRKQRETRRGRAELKLEERAETWNAKPENRYLPSVGEYVTIRTLTEKKHWTAAQRGMMARATRVHGLRATLSLLLLVAFLTTGLAIQHRIVRQQEAARVRGLVDGLASAEPSQLSGIIADLRKNPAVAASYLDVLLQEQATTLEEKRVLLHARLATVAKDAAHVDPLVEELLGGKITYVLPIREQLRPRAAELTERLTAILRDDKSDTQRRFRAALALADYVPESDTSFWTESDLALIAQQLVVENSEFQPLVRDALRPIRQKLFAPLESIFKSTTAKEGERLSAANAFADYARDDMTRLAALLLDATAEQYRVLYPLVAASKNKAVIKQLAAIVKQLPPDELGSVDRVAFGQRRANAAVTLLNLGERETVLPVFQMTDDPEALTQFIFRFRPRGVGIETLLELFDLISDAPKDRYPANSRYALLLSLGEFSLAEVPEARRDSLIKKLADWYAHDPSSGVHGASGWLLRQWGQTEIATQVDQTPVAYSADREWFTLAIEVTPNVAEESEGVLGNLLGKFAKKPTKLKFYYTFIVFPAGEYSLGSSGDEPDRQEGEEPRRVRLTRPFAICDRETSWAELIAFDPLYQKFMRQMNAQTTDAGVGVTWYDSVAYGRWLGIQKGLMEHDQAYAAPESLDVTDYPRELNSEFNWAPRDWPLNLDRQGFRLPTEAEWEVACRQGNRTAYGFGGDSVLLEQYGWYAQNSVKRVHAPRGLRPSLRGLFDVHGNVFEWSHDWGESGVMSGVRIDPTGPLKGSERRYRGGGWNSGAARCRSAIRFGDVPTSRGDILGFRLALSPSGASGPAERVKELSSEPEREQEQEPEQEREQERE